MTLILWLAIALALAVIAAIAVAVYRARREVDELVDDVDEDEAPATAGAQRQIDALEERLHRGLRAMLIAGALFVLGLAFTGWQIYSAFDQLEDERLARSNAAASINTFLCQRIDAVGNGVAALITVSLRDAPPPSELTPTQRRSYFRYLHYAEEQERPPRCQRLAREIAIITGSDPTDVVITPIHLEPAKTGHPKPPR